MAWHDHQGCARGSPVTLDHILPYWKLVSPDQILGAGATRLFWNETPLIPTLIPTLQTSRFSR